MLPLTLAHGPGGKDAASGASGVLPSLTRHTWARVCPFSSLNRWCEQVDLVWTWGKGRLPWEGPAANMETLPPGTGAQGHWTCSSTPPLPHFCASSLYL